MTKKDIEEKILEYKQMINDYDTLVMEYGSEDAANEIVEEYKTVIEKYKNLYQSAPDEYMLKECDWKFHSYDYYQIDALEWEEDESFEKLKKTYQIQAVTDNLNGYSAEIVATNRNEADYVLHTLFFYYTDTLNISSDKKVTENDAVSIANETLDKLNLGDWSVDSVIDNSDKDVSYYQIIYAPQYNNIAEILGPMIDLTANDQYASNYYYSNLTVGIYNGLVYSVELVSPMDIVKIENENVLVKPFSEIYEIFSEQIQQKYTKASVLGLEVDESDSNKVQIIIDKIKLGMTRIKEKDNDKEFLLVPAWSFSGSVYVNGSLFWSDTFVTINAIDGSPINTSLGY